MSIFYMTDFFKLNIFIIIVPNNITFESHIRVVEDLSPFVSCVFKI